MTVVELDELTEIHAGKPDEVLDPHVAIRLTHGDAPAACMREKMGTSEIAITRPPQATAGVSDLSFAADAIMPVTIGSHAASGRITPLVVLNSPLALAMLGASCGEARIVRGVVHVMAWGALAMSTTAMAGSISGGGI